MAETVDYTIGLDEVQFGTADATGTMPAPSATIKVGKVYKGTCTISQDAADVTEHFEEGKGMPLVRNKSKKAPTIAFSLVLDDLEILTNTIGGTLITDSQTSKVTGWGFNGEEDETADNHAVRLVTKQGLNIEIPNGDIDANINSDLSQDGIFLVEVTVTPMAVSNGYAFNCVKKSTSNS